MKQSPPNMPSEMDKDLNQTIKHVAPDSVFQWLQLGAADIHRSQYRSLVFGACFVLMGFGLERAHTNNPVWLLTLVAGFMLFGPVLASGLYELSRQVRQQEPADILLALFCWCRNPRQLGIFSLLCAGALAILAWGSQTLMGELSSASLVDGLSFRWAQGAAGQIAVLSWSALWVSLALFIFMVGAVGVPLIVDQSVSAFRAMVFSFRCCLRSPIAFLLWALIILLTIGLSLLLDNWPLLITGPLIGHATWHTYQTCIGEQT